jgi:hypothetical protein
MLGNWFLKRRIRKVIHSVDAGGVPMFISRDLHKLALDAGVVVTNNMTPNILIERLRTRV